MMIVLILSKCPPGLKGDVTKWLVEVKTGVYVGKLNTRVRDLLWKRVCEHCAAGEAVMVFSQRNEQGFSFYVHNTDWAPTDFDGIILPKKPLPSKLMRTNKNSHSLDSGEKRENTKSTKSKKTGRLSDITTALIDGTLSFPKTFVSIDLETTGLKSDEDSIIEIAAVRCVDGQLSDKYHALIKCDRKIPDEIVKLTGITDKILDEKGRLLEKALFEFLDFVGNDIIIGHYISFDILFLKNACQHFNIKFNKNYVIDTMTLAKAKCNKSTENFKLATLVKYLGIAENQEHRALPDAILAAELFLKLNEK